MANNLLLVDESPLIYRVVELTMEGSDISVYSAKDIEEALTLARSLKPDFILTSTTFKRNSGFDFCRTLSEDIELNAIPVLFLANAKEKVSHDDALEAGAIGVLTKPFEPEILLDLVGKALAWESGTTGGEIVNTGTLSGIASPTGITRSKPTEVNTPPSEIEGEPMPVSEGESFDDETVTIGPLADIADPASPPGTEDLEELFKDAPTTPSGETPPSVDDNAKFDELDMITDSEIAETPMTGEMASPREKHDAEPAPAAEGEIDSTMMAVEQTLAGEFQEMADEEPATDDAVLEKTAPPPPGEEIDLTQLAAETELAEEFNSPGQEGVSVEESASSESEEALLGPRFLPGGEADLKAAESELASIQAEIAADFEAPPGHDKGGLENLADDQIAAAEEELSAIQDELAAERTNQEENKTYAQIPHTVDSEYGTTTVEAEQLFDELEFRETGIAKEEPKEDSEAEVEATATEAFDAIAEPKSDAARTINVADPTHNEGISSPEEDDFWQTLDSEKDEEGHTSPPLPPEIFEVALDHKGSPAEVTAQESADEISPGPGITPKKELIEPLITNVGPGTTDAPSPILPKPVGTEDMKITSESIQNSLEQTVESVVPPILRRIESIVVEHLPIMVEKIVLREIEKIKRGE